MKPNKSPDADGFITVTYKGKKNRNCKKSTSLKILDQNEHPKFKSGVFDKKKFESTLQDIRNSNFFINFKETLLFALKTFDGKANSDNSFNFIQNVEKLSLKKNEMLDIICYGLGQFTSCIMARYQLAFLIILKDILLPNTIFIFDPVFSNEEKKVLENFGLTVLDENEEGKRNVFNRTIFFMPHCDLALYNNLLWANWNQKSLSKLILIGNSFQQYYLDRTEKCLKEKATYIYYASKFVTEVKMNNDFKWFDIFNNLSLHYFHIKALSEVPSKIWKDNTEPVYDNAEIIKNV